MTQDRASSYRGRQFRVQARHDGLSWTGHFQLIGIDPLQAHVAAEAGRHRWTPTDPGWATRPEAEHTASQAAHAAIDALAEEGLLPPV